MTYTALALIAGIWLAALLVLLLIPLCSVKGWQSKSRGFVRGKMPAHTDCVD